MTQPEALVLVPGLMSDEALWQTSIAKLQSRLPIQVADHGDLDSLTAMAARVLAHAPDRFALAGHSMGGRVALEVMRMVVRQAPQRVTHLALLDTGCHAMPSGDAGNEERAARQALVFQAESQGVAAMTRTWVKGVVHPSRWHDAALIDGIVTMFARKSVDVFKAQVRALLARPEAGAVLQDIACPTLVLCGSDDANSPPAANRDMAAALADAQLVVVERCGHMSMLEQPDAVNAALDAWLNR